MFSLAAAAASLLMAATAASGAAHPESISATIEAGWHSKYITQGRDNLEDGGLFTLELTAEHDSGVFAGVWANLADDDGSAAGKRYQETNLYAGIGRSWDDFPVELSYTWLHFYPTEDHGERDDNEFLLVVGYDGMDYVEVGLNGGMPLSDNTELGFYISHSFRGRTSRNKAAKNAASATKPGPESASPSICDSGEGGPKWR